MQYLLWFGQFLFTYSMIVLLFKMWKKEGLFIWTIFSIIFANMQVVKLIPLFGLDATLGNTLYLSSFFVTDMISEFYGKEEAKKAMYMSLLASFFYLIYGQFTIAFTPLAFDTTAHDALKVLFYFSPRVVLASFICYWFSQSVDISLYHRFTQANMLLWQKNFFSTFISQVLDSFLFVFIAFLGVFKGTLHEQFPVVMQIAFSTFFIKTFVNIIDIPFLYIIRYIYKIDSKDTR